MIRISPVEAILAVVLLSPVAAGLGAAAAWILGAPLVPTALLTGAVPLLAIAAAVAADLRTRLRRRRAMADFARLARPIRPLLAPGLLWDPRDGLRAHPTWETSAHDRIRMEAAAGAAPPIPTPPGWDATARTYYGRDALNDPPGLWMDREGRLHLAHMRVAGAPFFPDLLPDPKDTP